LERRNFWFTAHCGNYVELCELQQAPSIFFKTAADDDSLYTLIVACPDYPYRTRPSSDGYFLHYMVCNMPGGVAVQPKGGDVVIPYVPPLPTEDAGTSRILYMLFKQSSKVRNVRVMTKAEEEACFPFSQRAQFRLHAERPHRAALESLRSVEAAIAPDPCALTFLTTKWDIPVQEFYESVGLPEPAYEGDEELEAILAYNAMRSEDLRIQSRHQADGSTVVGNDPNQWMRWQQTLTFDGSMAKMWSRRTTLGPNKRPIVFPS
jgi:hypothetical protein